MLQQAMKAQTGKQMYKPPHS